MQEKLENIFVSDWLENIIDKNRLFFFVLWVAAYYWKQKCPSPITKPTSCKLTDSNLIEFLPNVFFIEEKIGNQIHIFPQALS